MEVSKSKKVRVQFIQVNKFLLCAFCLPESWILCTYSNKILVKCVLPLDIINIVKNTIGGRGGLIFSASYFALYWR